MTLKQYLVAGVIEQAIMFGIILPATGWWFSFFAISAIWNLVAGGFQGNYDVNKINSRTLTGSWVCHIYKTMIETLIMIEIIIFVIATLNQ